MIVSGMLLTDPDRPPAPGWLRIHDGRIAELHETGDRPPDDQQHVGGPNRLIVPGFIDAHNHPPQFDVIGCDGLSLLEWLDRVVYPVEIWWGRGAAAQMMRHAISAMLSQGTVGFAGLFTSHGQSAHEAVNQILRRPRLRALVGRIAMDRNAPDALTAEDHWRANHTPRPSVTLPDAENDRVGISVNPRFAPACSEELLAETGWFLQENPGAFLQTHLAETGPECELVKTLFPEDRDYTSVYDRFGLLTPRSLLAHCVQLTDPEWDLIAERGSVVVHCPTANHFLGAGLFNFDAVREREIRFALGSDIAAGPDVSMPRVACAMIDTTKMRQATVAPHAHIPTPAEAWRQITEGNADALGWTDSGRLRTNAWADLLLLRVPESWYDEFLVGRLIYNWSPAIIEHRIVAGDLADPATI